MTSKKALVWWVPSVMVLCFIALKSFAFKTEPATKYQKIMTTVAYLLEQGHYSPKKIDDTFSKEIFGKYLSEIDPDKNIFLQSDINQLKPFETKIDDELNGSNPTFIPAVNEIYSKRIIEATNIYKEILSKPFDFNKDEAANLDGDKIPFAKNEAERKEYWRKRLKLNTLERYADALEQREANRNKKDFVVKDDATLEQESRELVLKNMDRFFNRLKNKFTEEEKFNTYIRTICNAMDPHTDFFPPVEKRAFDEVMSGGFFGIGAQLTEADGSIKIASVITGSPAWKSGAIQANDIILKVAQGAADPVDISGFETQDAVKLIRGKQGTEVRLTMKKVDGTIKVVPIIREKITTDETYARSAIVKKDGSKIGFIYLPEFYADFNDPNSPRCAKDVAIEIKKLKDEKVDGIVMDLRNNGGGSLQDVIEMVGLFIDEGPVVQVKDKEGRAQVYKDKTKGILYDGPLAVMINENSASASEIFAAAIQDYKRGMVIGSKSYGKGTVQRSVGVDKNIGFFVQQSELGSVKMTIQKFYRVNGGSTQLKGVTPDILIPDLYEFSKAYDKEKKDELPWDEIAKAPITPWENASSLQDVKIKEQARVNSNEAFINIHKHTQLLSQLNDKNYELNLKKYKEEQNLIKATVKKIESSISLSKDTLNISFMKADDEKVAAMDKDKAERFRGWLKALTKDVYLNETINVVNDLILQGKTVKN